MDVQHHVRVCVILNAVHHVLLVLVAVGAHLVQERVLLAPMDVVHVQVVLALVRALVRPLAQILVL